MFFFSECFFLEVRYSWMLRVGQTRRGLKMESDFLTKGPFPYWSTWWMESNGSSHGFQKGRPGLNRVWLPSQKLTVCLHLKMDDWNAIYSFLLGRHSFRCYVSFTECIIFASANVKTQGIPRVLCVAHHIVISDDYVSSFYNTSPTYSNLWKTNIPPEVFPSSLLFGV